MESLEMSSMEMGWFYCSVCARPSRSHNHAESVRRKHQEAIEGLSIVVKSCVVVAVWCCREEIFLDTD